MTFSSTTAELLQSIRLIVRKPRLNHDASRRRRSPVPRRFSCGLFLEDTASSSSRMRTSNAVANAGGDVHAPEHSWRGGSMARTSAATVSAVGRRDRAWPPRAAPPCRAENPSRDNDEKRADLRSSARSASCNCRASRAPDASPRSDSSVAASCFARSSSAGLRLDRSLEV